MKITRAEWLRPVLFLLGLFLLAYVVHRAGPARVLDTARAGLVYLPGLVLCIATYFVCEACGQRTLLGEARSSIPSGIFARATMMAYVATTLLPVGRAGAEMTRVGAFSPYVGTGRALAASTTFQVPVLWGTAFHGVICAVFAATTLGPTATLTWVLCVHAVASAALGTLLYLLLRRVPFARALGRWFPGIAARMNSFDEALVVRGALYLSATMWCALARVAETCQYALLLAAVGLSFSLPHSLLASGIQLVGATVGEAIPGQLGAVEGAFVYFADALGLGAHAPRAVTIPLLGRVAQFGLAALALVILNPWTRRLPQRVGPEVDRTIRGPHES